MNAGAILDSILAQCAALSTAIGKLLDTTQLPEQFKNADLAGLFSNPWFLVPLIAFVAYMLYKKAIRDLLVLAILAAVWYASKTPYMQTLVVGDELQIKKIIPVLLGGVGALGAIVYLLMGRSD